MNKNKFIKNTIAVSLALLTATGSIMPVMAATQNVNSVGSVAEDISNSIKVGTDTNQNKVSEYKTYSADTATSTDVYVTQTSTFSVVAPVIAIIGGVATRMEIIQVM